MAKDEILDDAAKDGLSVFVEGLVVLAMLAVHNAMLIERLIVAEVTEGHAP